jgi:ribonucleotide reductase alpha subunit
MFIFPIPPAAATQEVHGIPLIRHKPVNEQPYWMTPEGLHTLKHGYLLEGETPWDMYKRVANAVAARLSKPELAPIFFSMMWHGWLGPATPVLSNMGTDRGLPISCNTISVSDSLHGIFSSVKELSHLSSKGAGVGVYIGNVRGRGEPIHSGGYSEGVIPWCKVFDSATIATSQGQTRRGATAMYLPFNHKDIREFLRMRRPQGDENQRCMNLHHAVCISDADMHAIESGDPEAVELYTEILKTRKETGEPYLFFTDNVNNPDILPLGYLNNNLKVTASNICLLGEELVATSEGPKQIKDLVGKTVTIWDGEQWVQNNSFEYKGHTNQLVEVTFRDGSKTRVTLNHRFPTEAFGFVEAKDLKHSMTVETHAVQYNGNVELEAAYLKGFLAADGTSYNGKPILWLYDTKYMCQERILSGVNSLSIDENCNDACITEANVKMAGENRVNVLGLTARKASLYPWCKEYKKQLPEEYLDWTFTSKVEFLAGLFDGDGTVVNSRDARCYQLASIHKGFLEQIQLLLKSLGIYSSLNCMRAAGKTDFNDGYGEYSTAACYRLTVSNSSAYKLADVCCFSRLPKFERPTKRGAYNTKPTYGKVQKVEIIDVDPVPTYCTEVPSTHKFALADGRMTGNCSEITAYTDELHTFVCCLSSMNLARWEEWKDTKAIYYAIWFLEGVIQEYIDKASRMVGFENAVRFAEKSRMLGLGVLGYHTLLQQKMIPFESYQARLLNKVIFNKLADETNLASKDLAKIYGEPEWCKGTGLRHTHTLTCAPTVSNSLICGHVSAGIEPLAANCFEKRGAKGVILYYNPIFKQLLANRGKDTPEVWDTIVAAKGSVQHLDFLTDEEKEVFLTAREINQMEIINQAADRQKLMDKHRQGQAQSVNLFFTKDVDETYYTRVHYQAWKKGLKTLYYCRSESASQADLPSRTQASIGKLKEGGAEECLACHG